MDPDGNVIQLREDGPRAQRHSVNGERPQRGLMSVAKKTIRGFAPEGRDVCSKKDNRRIRPRGARGLLSGTVDPASDTPSLRDGPGFLTSCYKTAAPLRLNLT